MNKCLAAMPLRSCLSRHTSNHQTAKVASAAKCCSICNRAGSRWTNISPWRDIQFHKTKKQRIRAEIYVQPRACTRPQAAILFCRAWDARHDAEDYGLIEKATGEQLRRDHPFLRESQVEEFHQVLRYSKGTRRQSSFYTYVIICLKFLWQNHVIIVMASSLNH